MGIILEISTVCLWIVVLFNLFLTFALVRRLNSKDSSGKEVRQRIVDLDAGENAPKFTARTLDGETVTLASFAGQKVALIFISTHCQPCEELLPRIKPLQGQMVEFGMKLILISTEEEEATRAYVEEKAITLPVLIAPRSTNTFIKDYKVNATPAFCFITAQGSIYRAGAPHLEGKEWQDLNEFLSEKPDFVVAGGGETEGIGLR